MPAQFKSHLSIQEVVKQVNIFKIGQFHPNLNRIITNDDVVHFNDDQLSHWASVLDEVIKDKTFVKFTPASGAASRMFKFLHEYLNDDIITDEVKTFFNNIQKFPFYSILKDYCEKAGISVKQSIRDYDPQLIKVLLYDEHMGYSNTPKALIKFHEYEGSIRTALYEHIVEGLLILDSKLNIHFTVSKEHEYDIEHEIVNYYAENGFYSAADNVHSSLSFQDPNTDTVAVDYNNELIINDGVAETRPGGHGALIHNLNTIDADIIIIKNIDNIVHESKIDDVIKYKRALIGYGIFIQAKIFTFLEILNEGTFTIYTEEHDMYINAAILPFIKDSLQIEPVQNNMSYRESIKWITDVLNRPLRVCGVVANEGEPGGAPYRVQYKNTISPQIVEKSQLDLTNETHIKMLNDSQYFNPVDIIAFPKSHDGTKFDLTKYIDESSYFISEKSKNGKTLKALEHPGLWNGAMADWTTILVEVPISTFNPVKTVLDLLKPNHQI